MLPWPAWIAIALLAGSVPFGLLIARAKGIDIRAHGSGNIGATNVGRVLGRRYFFLCFTLDVLKGLAPTLAAGWNRAVLGHADLTPSDSLPWLATMFASVLGHVFCPWLRFRGGKGVATAAGSLLGVFPVLTIAGVTALLLYLACLKISRFVSVSSMLAAVSVPITITASLLLAPSLGLAAQPVPRTHALPFVGFGVALAALVLWTHRANMARLRAGTEPRLGQRVRVAR